MLFLRLLEGLLNAGLILAVNAVVASGSYAYSCNLGRLKSCSVANGVAWILKHPVFPDLVPVLVLLGFVFGCLIGPPQGARTPRQLRWMNYFGWVVIVLFIVAFIVWGVPELKILNQAG